MSEKAKTKERKRQNLCVHNQEKSYPLRILIFISTSLTCGSMIRRQMPPSLPHILMHKIFFGGGRGATELTRGGESEEKGVYVQ